MKSASELANECSLTVTNDYTINAWLNKATIFVKQADMDTLEGQVEAALSGYWRFTGYHYTATDT